MNARLFGGWAQGEWRGPLAGLPSPPSHLPWRATELSSPADLPQAFESTLQKEQNRFRTVYGAANAMWLAGDSDKPRRYYSQLLEICAHADVPGRAESPDGRGAVKP